jgi:hypothetical protein
MGAVMDAIAATAKAAGLVSADRAYAWPTLTVNPPCLVVGYPTAINYDATYARGFDRATFPFWIICGRIDARTTRDQIATYIGPDGAASVKTAMDGPLGGAVQSARVMSATIEATTISGVDYQAVRFDLDVLT